MKRYLYGSLIILALTLGGSSASSGQASQTRDETGVAEFIEPVKLLGVTLKGRYLFLHHTGMMQRGKPCLYVFALSDAHPGRFIISFRCIPARSERVGQLTFKLSDGGKRPSVPEILEIQFAGSAESHKVTAADIAASVAH